MTVREKEAMSEAGKILKKLIAEDPVSLNDAFTQVNEQMAAMNAQKLRYKNFKQVVDDLLRSNDVVQRGDQLQKP